jgi:hypothetical protein
MTAQTGNPRGAPVQRAPFHVRLFSAILKVLLDAGVPLGFNRVVTIRGRNSGVLRNTPLAVIEVSGRRWAWAPWGDVQWVRNLRAAGRATIAERNGKLHVRAIELDTAERVAFFRDVLGPLARSIPGGHLFIRVVDGVDLADPVAAAQGRPVFELRSMEG